MGCDISGQINFGIAFGEGFEFPWDDEKYDGIESWWMDIHGYVPLYKPFTPEGNYAEGWTHHDPRFGEYFTHQGEWMEKNPIPVEVDSFGTGDYSLYMIILPKVGLGTSWDATKFDPKQLVVSGEQVKVITDFLDKYEIEYEDEPAWLLSSYYSGE